MFGDWMLGILPAVILCHLNLMIIIAVICLLFVDTCNAWLAAGARAESSTRLRGGESQNLEGVRGLKALGVRDLNYRMAFLACTVIPCNNKVTSLLCLHSLYVYELLLQ